MIGWLILTVAQSAPTFDIEIRAAALPRVLAEISSVTGAPLKVSTEMDREVLLVSVRNVSVSDLKAKIAEAVHANWVKKSDADYLDRSPKQENEVRTAHVALRRKWVEAAKSTAKRSLDKLFDAGELATGLAALGPRSEGAASRQYYERERSLFDRGPLSRVLKRLLLAVSSSDLAAIDPFSREVFSADPSVRQKRIPKDGYEAAIRVFSQEQEAWREAAGKVVFQESPNGRMVTDPRAQLHYDPARPLEFRLEIRRGEMAALFMANLLVKNSDGSGWSVVCQETIADPQRIFLDAEGPVAPSADDSEVKLSSDSQAMLARMSEVYRNRTAASLEPRVLEILSDLETHEPLSWTASDLLLAYAAGRKVNMVASIPDQAVTTLWFLAHERPLLVRQGMQLLADSGTVSLSEKDGWAIVSPADRYEQTAQFVPRRAISELIRNTHAKSGLDIVDFAEFAFRSGQPSRMHLGAILLPLVDPSIASTMDRTSWTALRLYGSLSARQRKDLESGARFGISGLSLGSRKIVETIVFAGPFDYGAELRAAVRGPAEPTDALPLGLPPSGEISARVQTRATVFAYGRGKDGKTRPMRSLEPWSLAGIELDRGEPEKLKAYGVSTLAGYALGQNRHLSIRIEPLPGAWKEVSITIPVFAAGAAPVPWDKLPEPLAKQIAEAMEQIRNQRATQPKAPPPPVWRR